MTDQNSHNGHRQRVRDTYMKHGLSNFHPHQILELLLFYTVPVRDTNLLAHRLLQRFGDLSGVLSASIDELLSVPGIGENSAVMLNLIGETGRKYADFIDSQPPVFFSSNEIGYLSHYVYTKYETGDERIIVLKLSTWGAYNLDEINIAHCKTPHEKASRISDLLKGSEMSYCIIYHFLPQSAEPLSNLTDLKDIVNSVSESIRQLSEYFLIISDSCHPMLQKNNSEFKLRKLV